MQVISRVFGYPKKAVEFRLHIFCESFHRVFKYKYLRGKLNKRVDKCLLNLIKFGSRKIPPEKIPTRKILTHQTLPWKIPPPPENSHLEYSHPLHQLSFFTISSLNTSSINVEENLYVQNSSVFLLEKN